MSLLKDKIELDIAEAELAAKKSLEGYPPVLKWIIILAALAVIPGYFAAKALSYKIWRQRLAAAEITAKPSFNNPQSPKLSAVTVIKVAATDYMAAAKIENPNLDLAAKEVNYRFNFYDSKNQLITFAEDKCFLLPNQSKYLVAPKITSLAEIARAEIIINGAIAWQKKISLPQVKLVTGNPYVYQQYDPLSLAAESSVLNRSPYNLGTVGLTVVVFDRNGNIIAVSRREEHSVASGERRAFKQLWPNLVASSLGQAAVYAETNILDKTNVVASQSAIPAGSPASDLSRPGDGAQNSW